MASRFTGLCRSKANGKPCGFYPGRRLISLVKVRYLANNPWAAVRDPNLTQAITLYRLNALPASLWDKLITILNERCLEPENKQARIARAILLLMGDSGLRRDEAAAACRNQLRFNQVVDQKGK